MNSIVDRFVLKFGIFVIFVSLLSGCASNGAYGIRRTAMVDPDELKWFSPNCALKAEQTRWLLSLRPTDDDQLFSLAGWMGEGQRVNWLIQSHLLYLKERC